MNPSKPYPPPGTEIPRALFSCSEEACRQEVSYEAEDLYWWAEGRTWVCFNCWEYLPLVGEDDDAAAPERGVSLAEFITCEFISAASLLRIPETENHETKDTHER